MFLHNLPLPMSEPAKEKAGIRIDIIMASPGG
jgi:hypothetical protein